MNRLLKQRYRLINRIVVELFYGTSNFIRRKQFSVEENCYAIKAAERYFFKNGSGGT